VGALVLGSLQAQELAVTARVRAVQEITIVPQVSGMIVERSAKRGSRVAKGEVLLRVDSELFELAVERAKALTSIAEASLTLARSHYARIEGLIDRGSVDQATLDEAKAQLQIRDAELQSARVHLRESEIQWSRTQITSPIDGYLLELHPEIGSLVTPQSNVAVVTSVDDLIIEAFLSSEERARVDSAKTLAFWWNKKEIHAPILEAAEAAASNSLFRLVLKVPEDCKDLRAGTRGSIVLP
jgi:membrane fusion protein (multidrug efflux system)